MRNFTTDSYETKRKITEHSKKLCTYCGQVESKFIMDMTYGILKSGSVLISDISESLNEEVKKINTEERLCRNLGKDFSDSIKTEYLKLVQSSLGEHPIVLVDDTDIVKRYGRKFESLGRVVDGSSEKKKIENGYYVTEITALTEKKKHPVSLFSHIHSSTEKGYVSKNHILYNGLNESIETLSSKATFVFDRGFDMNELYKFMFNKDQNFVVRMKENRKVFFKGKWMKATTLRDSRKGKIKTEVLFQGEKRECYISHINCQITASKKNMFLVLVYGLGKKPMMLATNCAIESKEDVVKILRTYMSRWRIEEYFRCKKVEFGFENYRVRKLVSMNNLNAILGYALGLLGMIAEKHGRSNFTDRLIKRSNSFKSNLLFYTYQLAKGIRNVLNYSRTGIKEWQKIRKFENCKQLEFKLVC